MKHLSISFNRRALVRWWAGALLSVGVMAGAAELDFERCAIQVGDIPFNVELARTPAQRQQGLMHRELLKKGEGMLFIFPTSRVVAFWMKDTSIPLTVGYFNAQGRLLEWHHLTPFSLRSVYSSQPVRYALELNRGEFRANNIAIGAQLAINCQISLARHHQPPLQRVQISVAPFHLAR